MSEAHAENTIKSTSNKLPRRTFLKLITMLPAAELLTRKPEEEETPSVQAPSASEVLPLYDAAGIQYVKHTIDGREMFFLPYSLLHAEPWSENGESFNVRTSSFTPTADIEESDPLLRQTGALATFGIDTFISPDFVQNNQKFLELRSATVESIDKQHLATLDEEEHDIYLLEQIGKTVKRLVPYKFNKNQPPYNTWKFDKRFNNNATDCLEHSFLIGLLAENIELMHNPYSEIIYFGYTAEGTKETAFHVAESFNIGGTCRIVDTTLQEHNKPTVFDFPDYIRHFETKTRKKATVLNTVQTEALFSTSIWHPWEEKAFVEGMSINDSND